MQIFVKPWFWLPCRVAISAQAVHAQPPAPARRAPSKVEDVAVADVLHRLGAELEQGSDSNELDAYANHFDRTDTNRDGKHTRAEYVDKGRYMTPQARAGRKSAEEHIAARRVELANVANEPGETPMISTEDFADSLEYIGIAVAKDDTHVWGTSPVIDSELSHFIVALCSGGKCLN